MTRIYEVTAKAQGTNTNTITNRYIAKWVNSEKVDPQKIQSEFEEFCQRESVNLEKLRPAFNKLFKIYISISDYSEKGCSACRMATLRNLLEISYRKLNADKNELAGAAKLYINYKKFLKNLIERTNGKLHPSMAQPRLRLLKLIRQNLEISEDYLSCDNKRKEFLEKTSTYLMKGDKDTIKDIMDAKNEEDVKKILEQIKDSTLR